MFLRGSSMFDGSEPNLAHVFFIPWVKILMCFHITKLIQDVKRKKGFRKKLIFKKLEARSDIKEEEMRQS